MLIAEEDAASAVLVERKTHRKIETQKTRRRHTSEQLRAERARTRAHTHATDEEDTFDERTHTRTPALASHLRVLLFVLPRALLPRIVGYARAMENRIDSASLLEPKLFETGKARWSFFRDARLFNGIRQYSATFEGFVLLLKLDTGALFSLLDPY